MAESEDRHHRRRTRNAWRRKGDAAAVHVTCEMSAVSYLDEERVRLLLRWDPLIDAMETAPDHRDAHRCGFRGGNQISHA
jgi:hypothetical protein